MHDFDTIKAVKRLCPVASSSSAADQKRLRLQLAKSSAALLEAAQFCSASRLPAECKEVVLHLPPPPMAVVVILNCGSCSSRRIIRPTGADPDAVPLVDTAAGIVEVKKTRSAAGTVATRGPPQTSTVFVFDYRWTVKSYVLGARVVVPWSAVELDIVTTAMELVPAAARAAWDVGHCGSCGSGLDQRHGQFLSGVRPSANSGDYAIYLAWACHRRDCRVALDALMDAFNGSSSMKTSMMARTCANCGVVRVHEQAKAAKKSSSDSPTTVPDRDATFTSNNVAKVDARDSKSDTVGEPMKVCSRCKQVHYCGADCQRKHWLVHKADCVKPRSAPEHKRDASVIVEATPHQQGTIADDLVDSPRSQDVNIGVRPGVQHNISSAPDPD